MGLIFKKLENTLELGVWEITESLDFLIKYTVLNETEKVVYDTLKSVKRKTEWLATRCLLAEFYSADKQVSIKYKPTGKPHLSNGKSISISHSNGFVTVAIQKNGPIGIDIQTPKHNIQKGDYFFMSTQELSDLKDSNSNSLHVYWCAKEALFKYADNNKITLTNDIIIKPFKIENEGRIYGSIQHKTQVELQYIISPQYYLVYTTD